VLDAAREMGFDRATVDVVEGTDATEFHRAMGWREIARETLPGGVLVVQMERDI